MEIPFALKSVFNVPAEAGIFRLRPLRGGGKVHLFDIDVLPARRVVADPAHQALPLPVAESRQDHVLCQVQLPAHGGNVHFLFRVIAAKQAVEVNFDIVALCAGEVFQDKLVFHRRHVKHRVSFINMNVGDVSISIPIVQK